MAARIRHCVGCPRCHTLYVIALSPYTNGSYLLPDGVSCCEEYALYCSCRGSSFPSRWRWSEIKTFRVSTAAYQRGYGAPDEILPVNR
jgi:hypothetical protein